MRALPAGLIVALVKRRARSHPGEESAERAAERVARVLPPRPEGTVVWLQSIGPGDSTALVALIEALREVRPGLHFLVTTRTVDAQGIFRKTALSGDVTLLLAPHDQRAAVRRFIDHWRPDVAVFGEGDLWPNTLDLLNRRGMPMALVNGQFNGRLGRLIGKLPGLGRWMMAHLSLLHAFSKGAEVEAVKWVTPGCDLAFHPNLKMDAARLAVKPEVMQAIRAAWGQSPVFFGASVAENEVEPLIRAHRIAARDIPGLKLLLAPRWKEEGAAFHAVAAAMGQQVPRRSVEGMPGPEDAVFIADSYGEFGVWLDLSFATYMGHTMFGGVGHNPYEPIIHERQVVAGAIPAFLASDYQYLADLGLCHVAATPEAIAGEMARLWQASQRGETGFEGFTRARGFSRDIATRILALI
jgi:3-deoxy-D-manno-octulosonic-acid transferase